MADYIVVIISQIVVAFFVLENFYQAVQEVFKPKLPIKKPDSWKEALSILSTLVEAQPAKKKIILFFDELPWLATKRSGLLQALEYEWNRKWSRNNNLKLIVCGSAASWVLENLIQAKGGLHNRIISEIGKKRNGILRRDLLEATGYKSGGTFKKRLLELRESGFIQEFLF